MNKFSLFALAMIASAATITPVVAAEPGGVAVVRTADLNLQDARDVRTLDQRLTIAIVDACGEASNVDLEGRNAVRGCRVDARAKANAERDRLVHLAQREGATKFASAH